MLYNDHSCTDKSSGAIASCDDRRRWESGGRRGLCVYGGSAAEINFCHLLSGGFGGGRKLHGFHPVYPIVIWRGLRAADAGGVRLCVEFSDLYHQESALVCGGCVRVICTESNHFSDRCRIESDYFNPSWEKMGDYGDSAGDRLYIGHTESVEKAVVVPEISACNGSGIQPVDLEGGSFLYFVHAGVTGSVLPASGFQSVSADFPVWDLFGRIDNRRPMAFIP